MARSFVCVQVIPRTLLQNCGADTIRVLTALRAKHAGGANLTWGVDGTKGMLYRSCFSFFVASC